ncbi:MAG TPA: hypothetical protein VII31_09645, partial [Caldimonas sp.]
MPENTATPARPFADLLRQSRDESAAPVAAPVVPQTPSSTEENRSPSSETNESANAPGPTPAAKAKARPTTPSTPKVTNRERPTEEAAGRVSTDKDKSAATSDANGAGGAAAGTARSDAWIAQTIAGENAAAGTRDRASDELRQGGPRPFITADDADAA